MCFCISTQRPYDGRAGGRAGAGSLRQLRAERAEGVNCAVAGSFIGFGHRLPAQWTRRSRDTARPGSPPFCLDPRGRECKADVLTMRICLPSFCRFGLAGLRTVTVTGKNVPENVIETAERQRRAPRRPESVQLKEKEMRVSSPPPGIDNIPDIEYRMLRRC